MSDRLANILAVMAIWLVFVFGLAYFQKRRHTRGGDSSDSSGDVSADSSSAHHSGWFGHSGDSSHSGDSGGHGGGDSGGDGGGGDGGGGDVGGGD